MLGLSCCGGTPTNTANVAPLPSATTTVQTPIAHRGPSDALVRAWPLEAGDGVAYVDVAGLAGTNSVAALIAATGPIIGPPLFNPDEATCARGLIAAVREIAIGVVGNDMVFVARVAGDLPNLGACVDGVAPIELAGAKQAYATGKDVVAVTAGGVFVYAERSIAERALRGDNDGRALRAIAAPRERIMASPTTPATATRATCPSSSPTTASRRTRRSTSRTKRRRARS